MKINEALNDLMVDIEYYSTSWKVEKNSKIFESSDYVLFIRTNHTDNLLLNSLLKDLILRLDRRGFKCSYKVLMNERSSYSEYIAENIQKSIDYSNYIAEQLDSSISYSEYISENLDKK